MMRLASFEHLDFLSVRRRYSQAVRENDVQ